MFKINCLFNFPYLHQNNFQKLQQVVLTTIWINNFKLFKVKIILNLNLKVLRLTSKFKQTLNYWFTVNHIPHNTFLAILHFLLFTLLNIYIKENFFDHTVLLHKRLKTTVSTIKKDPCTPHNKLF